MGAELELLFTDLLSNGQGVARAGEMAVFCFGPLPHERARVRISEVKRRYAVGEMIERLSDSSDRAEPFCRVFGECGGCQVQHLAYPAQLAWKQGIVRNALARIGGLNAVVGETIGMSNPRAYRNKMALVVDHAAAQARLGFYRQRSHDVVPIDTCPVVTPQLDATLGRIEALSASDPVKHMLADARHIVARSARTTGQVVVSVTTERQSRGAAQAARLLVEEAPWIVGVTNSFDLSSANAIAGRNHRVLCGTPEIEEEIGGVRYRVSAGSFFQINAEMVGRIFEFLSQRLGEPGSLVDLYCGIGTFALFFAKRGWNVVGVEENARAVAEAVANARLNGLESRAAFVAARVETALGTQPLRSALRRAPTVFLDPPRKGCDDVTLAAIARARVPRLWYLSCDAATLARDLKFLAAKGYRLEIVQPFDMFPQTGHVETLVLLEYSDLVSR
ncbi:MAG TPA: 23S rRNA (uracil(1939)-C(5))-methyltransferase RlmD [Candidatus Binatia bacterium]|nr:23S rRNA (uracil(1939)-C(5))-methyltransferase RlmD [Candidatus Binatia bacterium]